MKEQKKKVSWFEKFDKQTNNGKDSAENRLELAILN